MRSSSRSLSMRWLTLALASWTLVAQLAANVHLATVRHAVCEHGELVEANHAHGELAQRHASIATEASASASEHEHCPFTSAHQRAVSTRVSTFACVAAPAHPCTPQPAPLERAPAIALLLIAPKSSPPV